MAGAVFHKDLPLAPIFMVVLCATGCVRRDGRNSDCTWPGETLEHSASPWHLSEDAEFAEDLAIRYADVHYWHTPYWAAYAAARDRCMGSLFEQIAKEHGVPVERVYSSLGHNRPYFDLAEVLSFALLYCFVAAAGARLFWQRYRFAEGWIPCVLMMSFLSLGLAVAGTMLCGVWSGIAENFRVGNGHLSYRGQRLFWFRHGTALFASMLILFWLAAVVTHRKQSNHSLPVKSALGIE
jgi:hypothetical protein